MGWEANQLVLRIFLTLFWFWRDLPSFSIWPLVWKKLLFALCGVVNCKPCCMASRFLINNVSFQWKQSRQSFSWAKPDWVSLLPEQTSTEVFAIWPLAKVQSRYTINTGPEREVCRSKVHAFMSTQWFVTCNKQKAKQTQWTDKREGVRQREGIKGG